MRSKIIERIWRIVAAFCARPLVREWIIGQAKETPYLHIGNYMHRWWLMPQWTLERNDEGVLEPKSWMPFAIRINHIKRPDMDPNLHDHPWNWRTIVLEGWYREENIFGGHNYYAESQTRRASAETFHRINDISDGGVFTMFITGRKFNPWGFLVIDDEGKPRKVLHHEYHLAKDRGELHLREVG